MRFLIDNGAKPNSCRRYERVTGVYAGLLRPHPEQREQLRQIDQAFGLMSLRGS